MMLPKREAVAMLAGHAAALKPPDWASHGLEIIKEAAVGCLRIATCVKQNAVLRNIQLVAIAVRCALESEDMDFTWPDVKSPPTFFKPCQELCSDLSMMSRCREQFAGHSRRFVELHAYLKAALQELDDPVFRAADNAEISALVQQAAEVFEDCLCFLTGFQKMMM